MKARTLRTVAIAAVVILVAAYIGAYILGNLLLPVHVEYMGLTYRQTTLTPSSGDELYYTGVTYNGAKLYIPVTFLAGMGCNGTEKVPSYICVKRPMGYNIYQLAGDNPAVFAYVPYERYNIGEPVTFGLMNAGADAVDLSSKAPWDIQRLENGEWKTIYHRPVDDPAPASVVGGGYAEWTWDQSGGNAGAGDYRALIDGNYSAYFTVTKGAPVVRSDASGYSEKDIQDQFMKVPEHDAFAEYYQNSGSRDDIASEMAFKAWKQGLPADKLLAALKSIMPASGGIEIPYFTGDVIPCRAIHIKYKGKPAWYFVFNWGMGGEKLDHIRHCVIDDGTGEQVYYLTCK